MTTLICVKTFVTKHGRCLLTQFPLLLTKTLYLNFHNKTIIVKCDLTNTTNINTSNVIQVVRPYCTFCRNRKYIFK